MPDAKRIVWWNEQLAEWFFRERGPRPVYLNASDAELELMNESQALGLDNAAAALIRSVGLYKAPRSDRIWRQRDPSTLLGPPPWLAYLAATVLIVARESEAGTLRFYEPLTAALDRTRRVTQHDYESSFYMWWNDLAWWLQDVHSGRRGTPTWSAIPNQGQPRSVIGHPYTQVLLQREDRRYIDEFLSQTADLRHDDLEITDRVEAAQRLFDQFAAWVRAGASISGRLRTLVSSNRKDEKATLGFILLGRIENAVSRDDTSGRNSVIRVVPTFDEWQRRLHLSAVAPAWVNVKRPLRIEERNIDFDEPGQPIHLDERPTATCLAEGMTLVAGQYDLELHGRPSGFVLAAREYSEWVAVLDPQPGERVYYLEPEAADTEQRSRSSYEGLPEGWCLRGPSSYEASGSPDRGQPRVSIVPRLVGGLKLGNRQFLLGGEPTLDLAIEEPTTVSIDGATTTAAGHIELASLGLEPGEHVVEAGPYKLSFWSIDEAQLPTVAEPLVRLPDNEVVVEGSEASVCGMALRNSSPVSVRTYRCPPEKQILLFGAPGQVAEVDTAMAEWASEVGLDFVAFDPEELSSYRGMKRPPFAARWAAGGETGNTWLMMLGEDDCNDDVESDIDQWRKLVERVGPSPRIILSDQVGGERQLRDTAEAVAIAWADYAATPLV